MANSNRREFLKSSAVAGARYWRSRRLPGRHKAPTIAFASAWWAWRADAVPHRQPGANGPDGNIEIAAICDCDQAKLDGATKSLS